QRPAVPLPEGVGDRIAAPRRPPRPTLQTAPRGPVARRGRPAALRHRRGQWSLPPDGELALRCRAAPDRVLPPPIQGSRPRPLPHHPPRRQGRQGPCRHAAALPPPTTRTGPARPRPAAPARPRPWGGARRIARRAGAQVPQGGAGAGLAVPVRLAATVALP